MLCSISLLAVVVAHLHIWAEQATTILMPTKISINMSKSVNPILLRPVLGIVLAINSVLLKMEQFMSWLQSGHYAISPFPEVSVTTICKTTQECASDAESVTLLSLLRLFKPALL